MTFNQWLESLTRQQFEAYIADRLQPPDDLEDYPMKPRRTQFLTLDGLLAVIVLVGLIVIVLGAFGIPPFSNMFHINISMRLTHD